MSTFLWVVYGIGVFLMSGFLASAGRLLGLRTRHVVLSVAFWPLAVIYAVGLALGDHVTSEIDRDATTKPESAS